MDCVREYRHESGSDAWRHGALLLLEPGRETQAGAISGGDVGDRPDFSRFIYRDEIGMVELRGGLRLTQKTTAELCRSQNLRQRDLQGDIAMQHGIMSQKNDPTTA